MLAPTSTPEAPSAVSFLPNKTPAASTETSTMAPAAPMTPESTASAEVPPVEGMEDESQIIMQNLAAHLDQLQDQDKMFLAEHLTPEFVRAIGLINGPEVAQYLNQYADPNKVLVPVPRQIAEQYLAEQQKQGSTSAPQGQQPPQGAPVMAPPATPPMAAPPTGMPSGMSPSAM